MRDAQFAHQPAADELGEGIVAVRPEAPLARKLVEDRIAAGALAGFRAASAQSAGAAHLVPGKVAQILRGFDYVVVAGNGTGPFYMSYKSYQIKGICTRSPSVPLECERARQAVRSFGIAIPGLNSTNLK